MSGKNGLRNRWFGAVLVILCGSTGCSFQESLLDGFFGGISNTISTIISNVLLGTSG